MSYIAFGVRLNISYSLIRDHNVNYPFFLRMESVGDTICQIVYPGCNQYLLVLQLFSRFWFSPEAVSLACRTERYYLVGRYCCNRGPYPKNFLTQGPDPKSTISYHLPWHSCHFHPKENNMVFSTRKVSNNHFSK